MPTDPAKPQRPLLPRAAASAVEQALRVFPVTVIMGARQTGKSTLARQVARGGAWRYVTLDDIDVREQAKQEPRSLLEQAPRLVIDEVQRVPELLLEIKRTVDEAPRREAGRFILTGSADLLVMRSVSESLAGRAGYVDLWPMTRSELRGEGRSGLWGQLYDRPAADWIGMVEDAALPRADWRSAARVGGYPVPAYELDSPADRETWFAGYVRTYLERDLRQLAAIDQIEDFRRLMGVASLRIGNLLNQAEVARDAYLSPATAHRYLNLLETSFQLVRVPPYAGNRTKRLTKSPKAFWCDAALALHLGRGEEPSGAHLENLVLTDLLTWRETQPRRPEILYWRTYAGIEVDFVLELDGQLVPVEVKATGRPRFRDTRGLRAFRDAYGDRVRGALLLHGGHEVSQMSDGILAAPWWRML